MPKLRANGVDIEYEIFGEDDAEPPVPIACGIATHEAIPGSELLLIEGMGHELSPAAWPRSHP